MISPNEEQLAKEQCDMTEALLEDVNSMIRVPLHNWGSYPIVVKKGTVIIIIIICLLYRNLHMEYIVQQIKLRINYSDCT